MLTLSRRLAVLLLALAIAAGQGGVCAGWMQSADDRMACCADEASCTMHGSEDGSTRVVTQSDADGCCIASERDDSAPSPSPAAFSGATVLALSSLQALVPEPQANVQLWRSAAPLPPSQVPKHLLLSVFLL